MSLSAGNEGHNHFHRLQLSPEELICLQVSQSALDNTLAWFTVAMNAFCTKAKEAYETAIEKIKKIDPKAIALALGQWICKNPDKALMIAACIIVPIIIGVAAPLLGPIGLSATGPVAGSIAAGIQASIGNVAAGSLFAILQSAAMGGYGVPTVVGTTWGAASAVGWGIAAWKMWRGKEKDGSNEGKEENLALIKQD